MRKNNPDNRRLPQSYKIEVIVLIIIFMNTSSELIDFSLALFGA